MNDYYSDVNSFEERSARRRAENWGRRYNQVRFSTDTRGHKYYQMIKTYTYVILSSEPKKQNYQAWKSPKGKAYQGIGEGELNSTGYQILSIDGNSVSKRLSGELRRL